MASALGMMWYDSDSKVDEEEKIRSAVAHFKKKYGQETRFCYVHPQGTLLDSVDGIEVLPSPYVLPNHYFVGAQALFSGGRDGTQEGKPG